MTWYESGDAFTLDKYEDGSTGCSVVAGYTAAEAAALVVEALPPATTYQTLPAGYVTHALSFAPGQFLRQGGLNVEDPPGFPQFEVPEDPAKLVAPWPFMPDRRPLRSITNGQFSIGGGAAYGIGGAGGFYAAVVKVAAFSGAICLARWASVTHSAYVRGASWTVTRTPLVSLWLHGDGSVSFRRSPSDGSGDAGGVTAGDPSTDILVTKTATHQPAQSAPGAVPFGQWVRLQASFTLDLYGDAAHETGNGQLAVRVNTTEVLGGMTGSAAGGWTINPAPGAPPSNPDDPATAGTPLGIGGWDVGSLPGSTGTVVLRDLVVYCTPGSWLRNWAITHVLPTIDHTETLRAAYTADTTDNDLKYIKKVAIGEDSQHRTIYRYDVTDTGRLRRRPWRFFESGTTLANQGTVLDTGALSLKAVPEEFKIYATGDGGIHTGPALAGDTFLGLEENGEEDKLYLGEYRACYYEYPTAAQVTAYGWDTSLPGVEWLTVTAATNGFQNDDEDQQLPLLWTEQFWLDEFPGHFVDLRWNGAPFQIELTQSRRANKEFAYGYYYFRGQAGQDSTPLVLSQVTGFSVPGTPAIHSFQSGATLPHFHLQSQVSAGAAKADVLHQSAATTPVAVVELTAYTPPAFQSLALLLVDSFGHYEGGVDGDGSTTGALRETGHLGGATTYASPSGTVPCYGFAQYSEYQARSAKWPTAFATTAGSLVEVVRPGRNGKDGALRVVGNAGVCRSLTDIDETAPYEPQIGFHWHAETPGADWDTDYVRLLTLYQLGDLTSWPPQLQLTLDIDRDGYLHVNRQAGALAAIPGSPAVELISTIPLGNGDLTTGGYIELRAALDAQTAYLDSPGSYASTVNGYLLLRMDDQDAGQFTNQPLLLDPLDQFNVDSDVGDNPRGSGTDFVVLGDDLLYPSAAHTVAGQFDDLYLGEVVAATPLDSTGAQIGDAGTAADLTQLPADFFGDVRVTPLLPIATTEDGGGWTLDGAATAHDTVNQDLPDGDTTTLRGPAAASRLLWQYPHVPEPSELGDGAEAAFKRFVGFQCVAVGRAEGSTSGSGGLTRPDAPMADPSISSPDGTMGLDTAPGPIPWKVWHKPVEQLTIAPFVFWQPGTTSDLEYGLTAHQFNALRIGPQAFGDCSDDVLTQWGVEVLAALPSRRRPRTWAYLL